MGYKIMFINNYECVKKLNKQTPAPIWILGWIFKITVRKRQACKSTIDILSSHFTMHLYKSYVKTKYWVFFAIDV